MIANAMVYSRFRYWTQVMMMPEEVINWFLWKKIYDEKSGDFRSRESGFVGHMEVTGDVTSGEASHTFANVLPVGITLSVGGALGETAL